MKTLAKQSKKPIKKSRIQEICERHVRIGGLLHNTLKEAIRIGELLTKEKVRLKHGEWLPWIEKNLPFSQKTAWNYMTAWDRRDELKLVSVTNLTEAYKLLEYAGENDEDEEDEAEEDTTEDEDATTEDEEDEPARATKPKKKKKKRAAPVSSKLRQELIELFGRLYKRKLGKEAYLGSTQYTIMTNLMRKQDHQEIIARLRLYFSNGFWFTEKNNFSLKGFIAHFNEIIDEEATTDQLVLPKKITNADECQAAEKLQQAVWEELKETPVFLNFVILHNLREQYYKKRGKKFQKIGSYLTKLLMSSHLEHTITTLDNNHRKEITNLDTSARGREDSNFTVTDIKADEDWKKAEISLSKYFKKYEIDPTALTKKTYFGDLVDLVTDEAFDFARYCEWYHTEKYPTKGFSFGLFLHPNVTGEYRNAATSLAESEEYLHTNDATARAKHGVGAKKDKDWIKQKISPRMKKEAAKKVRKKVVK